MQAVRVVLFMRFNSNRPVIDTRYHLPVRQAGKTLSYSPHATKPVNNYMLHLRRTCLLNYPINKSTAIFIFTYYYVCLRKSHILLF